MKNSYHPRSMLVTGGAGFIGANFIHYALQYDPQLFIVNLDKLTYAGSLDHLVDLDAKRHHLIQGDINDAKLLAHLMQHHHIDTIVHFAAESHVDRSISNPSEFITTNIEGTFTLLEMARHHWLEKEKLHANQCRFHHISTDEVFGSLQFNEASFTENHPYRPRSPYAASKASADHLALAYYHTYGLPLTLSNCSNNYGPYQHKEKFIPTIIHACLNQTSIPLYGDGKQVRDWLYVKDHCRGIMDIIVQGKIGETYNLGGNNEWENIALAAYICDQMDHLKPAIKPYQHLLSFVTDRQGHDLRYAIDHSKITQELGWTPQEPFESGILKTIEYYSELA